MGFYFVRKGERENKQGRVIWTRLSVIQSAHEISCPLEGISLDLGITDGSHTDHATWCLGQGAQTRDEAPQRLEVGGI